MTHAVDKVMSRKVDHPRNLLAYLLTIQDPGKPVPATRYPDPHPKPANKSTPTLVLIKAASRTEDGVKRRVFLSEVLRYVFLYCYCVVLIQILAAKTQ